MSPPTLSSEHRVLLNSRCDVVVASRNAALQPSVCWAMAGHVHEDHRSITVWLRRDQAGDLLPAVQATGMVAAVFCVPLTSVSLQLKGRDARVRDARQEDAEMVRSHTRNLVHELALVGFSEAFSRTVFDQPLDLLLAIEFTVHSLYEQTPGPRAGQLIDRPT